MSYDLTACHGYYCPASSSQDHSKKPPSISAAPQYLFDQTIHRMDTRTLETKEEYPSRPYVRIPTRTRAPTASPKQPSSSTQQDSSSDTDGPSCSDIGDFLSSDTDGHETPAHSKYFYQIFPSTTTDQDIIQLANKLEAAGPVQCDQRSSITQISFYGSTKITDRSLPFLEKICRFYPQLKTLNLERTGISDAIRKSSLWKLPNLMLAHCYKVTPLPKERNHDLNVDTLNCGVRIYRKPNILIKDLELTCYRTHEIYEKYQQDTFEEQMIPGVGQGFAKDVGEGVRYHAAQAIVKIEWHREPQRLTYVLQFDDLHQAQKV